ncbi:MAG: hypothetical protein ACYC3X_22590 [Pirellulaceae bacterium]
MKTTYRAALIKELALADLCVTEGNLQQRSEGIDASTLDEYTQAVGAGTEFPPIVVFVDSGGHHHVSDGYHRIAAHFGAGKKTILAEIREGSLRDALLFACGANTCHGLRRTNADKRRAVETILEDEEWRGQSDRWIAVRAAVSNTFVGEIRRELDRHLARPQLSAVDSCAEPKQPNPKRTGRDGKERKLPQKTKPRPSRRHACNLKVADEDKRKVRTAAKSRPQEPPIRQCGECGSDSPRIEGRGKEGHLCPGCFDAWAAKVSAGGAGSCHAIDQQPRLIAVAEEPVESCFDEPRQIQVRYLRAVDTAPIADLIDALAKRSAPGDFVSCSAEALDRIRQNIAMALPSRKDATKPTVAGFAKACKASEEQLATKAPNASPAELVPIERRDDGWYVVLPSGATEGPFKAKPLAREAANRCRQRADKQVGA